MSRIPRFVVALVLPILRHFAWRKGPNDMYRPWQYMNDPIWQCQCCFCYSFDEENEHHATHEGESRCELIDLIRSLETERK